MVTLSFQYEITYDHPDWAILPIRLRVGQRHRDMRAMVDSGSAYSLFDQEIAGAFGLNIDALPRTPRPIGGLDGDHRRRPMQRGAVQIQAGPNSIANIQLDVVFFSNLMFNIGVEALLGTRDFFNSFLVGFDHRQRLLYLGEVT